MQVDKNRRQNETAGKKRNAVNQIYFIVTRGKGLKGEREGKLTLHYLALKGTCSWRLFVLALSYSFLFYFFSF